MHIFIVIPLFNEEKHTSQVIKSIARYKLPIVVVDDGSVDESRLKIEDLRLKNVTVLEHKVNLGKGAAMKTGADYAFGRGADAVIFMDSDGQHLASDLPKFIQALKSGSADMVFGSRNLSYGVPFVRYIGNKVASVIAATFFDVYVSDAICGFRALTKKAYKKVRWDSRGYGVEIEMIARVGKNKISHIEVPVETIYHDAVKGVTLLDAFGILLEVVKWKLTL